MPSGFDDPTLPFEGHKFVSKKPSISITKLDIKKEVKVEEIEESS